MPPVTYQIVLGGRADDGAIADVQDVFVATVRALREAGVTVSGVLAGTQNPVLSEVGVAGGGIIVHDLAGDVGDVVATAPKPAGRRRSRGASPDEVMAKAGDTPEGYRATSLDARQSIYDMALGLGILEKRLEATDDDGVTEVWIEDGSLHETVAGKDEVKKKK